MTRSRRSLLRGVATLLAGGLLGGLSGATAGATPGPTPLFAAERGGKKGTTLAATVDPSVHNVIGSPPTVDPLVEELRSRYPSVELGRFGALSVGIRLEEGRVVGGAAVAEGAFDRAALRSDLAADGVALAAASGRPGAVSVPETPYAVGVGDASIAIGYGPTAVSDADSALRRGPSRGDGIPAAFTGDAVTYATLGSGTRSHLLDRSDESVAGLDNVLRAAEAFGISLGVGEDQSDVRYGIVADPRALSTGDLWTFVSRTAAPEASIDVGSASRHGRLLVLDVTVETDDLWAVHERLFRSLSATV